MTTWRHFATEAPDLAARIRANLDAYTNKTIATVRRNGAPRISAIETHFADDDLWIGSMWQAQKARDLQRDRRFALHSGTGEPPPDGGDSKLAGMAEEITEPAAVSRINEGKAPPGPSHLFRLDVREASALSVDMEAQELVIEVWTPDRGTRTIRRK